MNGIQAMVRQMQSARPLISKKRNVPDIVLAQMLKMRRNGDSFETIAKATGMTYERVRYTLL